MAPKSGYDVTADVTQQQNMTFSKQIQIHFILPCVCTVIDHGSTQACEVALVLDLVVSDGLGNEWLPMGS